MSEPTRPFGWRTVVSAHWRGLSIHIEDRTDDDGEDWAWSVAPSYGSVVEVSAHGREPSLPMAKRAAWRWVVGNRGAPNWSVNDEALWITKNAEPDSHGIIGLLRKRVEELEAAIATALNLTERAIGVYHAQAAAVHDVGDYVNGMITVQDIIEAALSDFVKQSLSTDGNASDDAVGGA